MVPRAKKATQQQLKPLLLFIEANETIRFGKGEPAKKEEAWSQLALHINALGGANKTSDHWKQAYTVWKSHIRSKIRKGEQLNELDKKCADVAGLVTLTEGNKHILEMGFDNQENDDLTQQEDVTSNVDGNEIEEIKLYYVDENTPDEVLGNNEKEETTKKREMNKRKLHRTGPMTRLDDHISVMKQGYESITAALNNIAISIEQVADVFASK